MSTAGSAERVQFARGERRTRRKKGSDVEGKMAQYENNFERETSRLEIFRVAVPSAVEHEAALCVR